MSNKEWILLISKEFNVSHTVAKNMLHSMYYQFDLYKKCSYNHYKRKGF